MTEQQRKAMEMALKFIVVSSAKEKAWYTTEEFEVVSALRQALAQPDSSCNGMPAYEGPLSKSQALAQPEQEPVVGMFEEKLPDQNPPPWSRSYRLKRDWVGLTDEEVEAWRGNYDFFDSALVREVEAKLKEKNT